MVAATTEIVTSGRGTYALILRADSAKQIRIGRWGTLDVVPGFYVYVGSAFGPGGVSARVRRHCRQHKKLRWHIDYLREVTTPVQAWCGYGRRDLEHRWAAIFSSQAVVPRHRGGLTSIPAFGCSDCRCESHLFKTGAAPDPKHFGIIAGMHPAVWSLPIVGEAGQHRATGNWIGP